MLYMFDGTWAEELAKQESQQTTIITKQDIAKETSKNLLKILYLQKLVYLEL